MRTRRVCGVIDCDGFCSCNVQGAGRVVDETGAVVIGHRGEGLLTSNARRQPSNGPSLNELGGLAWIHR